MNGMKRKNNSKAWCLLALFALAPTAFLPAQHPDSTAFRKVAPVKAKLQMLPLNEVKPAGWLQQELQKNLGGFTGHLDSLAPDLILQDDIYGKDRLTNRVKNKNLGAVSDAGDWQAQFLWWNSETQSNWLDGFVRSAVLLGDKAALQKAERLINHLLATQDADGYIGIYDKELRYRFDNENGELWAKATLYRVLLGWYEYTKDKRILTAVEKAVDNVMQAWPIYQSHPFYSVNPNVGGITHGLAFTDVLEHLYSITRQPRYMDYCLFLYQDFSSQVLNEDAQFSKLLNSQLPLKGHGVHTYEHLRSVVAAYYASGNPALKNALDNFLVKIQAATTPSGAPIGDEFVGGRAGNAATGYEYCSLHELMVGWTSLLAKSAGSQYADKAERLFFNAALGNTHPTESAICYLKQDNAFVLTGGNNGDTTDKHQTRYRYSPVHKEAAVCCVPNAGRIVPYYIQSMWMKDEAGLTATLLGPCEVTTTVKNTVVNIREETDYPFDNHLRFVISAKTPAKWALRIRKPDWAASVQASLPYREEAGFLVFEQVWKPETVLTLGFEAALVVKETVNKEVYFESGPWVLCHEITGRQTITKTYTIPGMRESVYAPVSPSVWLYDNDSVNPVAGRLNTYTIKMINSATGQKEELQLVPMARTILRQVSFERKSP
jgi:DUF1680 family protein